MSTDDPRTLLHDAAAGPVAPLDHDSLRRRARNRTRTRWSAAAVAVLTIVAGVGTLVANLAPPPNVDVAEAPAGTVDPAASLPGLPQFPVTLDLPPVGEVTAVHIGERPVFVVHRDGGEVLVLDAISPHTSTELPKVAAYCRDPWIFETEDEQTVIETPGVFRDLWHGSLFALDGAWLGGPAPTGLPRYQVLSVDGDTVDIGPPGPAPEREVGPFEEVLGPTRGRSVPDGTTDCINVYDQTRSAAQPDDPMAVLWHEPRYPDRWLYPFAPADGQVSDRDNEDPLLTGEQQTAESRSEGVALAAFAVVFAFIAAVAAGSVYLRRREQDGSFDPGESSVSRPGLRRLFDFGRGGWSEDGKNQPPKD